MSDRMLQIEIEGRPLRTPIDYTVDVDLLQLADAITLTLPADAETWSSCPLDAEYRVSYDGVALVTGFIDARSTRGGTVTIQGRDRTGRLVDESLPGAGLRVGDKRLSTIILDIVRPWFDRVVFSNAADREARSGRGPRGRTASEPADFAERLRAIPKKFDAGTTRSEALRAVLEPHGLLAWSAGDGRTLIVTRPNYRQTPQYQFIDHRDQSNVISLELAETTRTLYQRIEVSGSGRADGDLEAGEDRNRIGVATSEILRHPKRLFVASEVKSQRAAEAMAGRLMRQGMAGFRAVQVVVPGHGQLHPGYLHETVYTVDTVAEIARYGPTSPTEDTPAALVYELMYVTRVTYRSDRTSGERTELSLVPLDVELL